ncbi:MAG: M1 family metallopeptidase [Myxococcota bacterium]
MPKTSSILRVLWAASVCAALPSEGRAQHTYELEARLDPASHEVEGRGTITWTNQSSSPQSEVFFHLYLNAFRDEDSVFMQESGRQLRGVRYRGRGSITVHALSVAGEDLLARADDEVIEGDHTQLRVPLPSPVEPGGSVTFELRWTSELPRVFARSGYHGDFHMVAQWFPKPARLEPDGTWASFPYHGHGEFYADFARYSLQITTPAGWVVGSSGIQTGEVERNGEVVRSFEIDRVHDVAFAAAPWFEERWSRYEDPTGHEVRVRVLFPPGFTSSVDTHLAVTLEGLAHYGEHFGEYPYDQLTVIVPPRGAAGAAGMEYPTLFVTAGPWPRLPGLPIALHDEVTAHELGHQWFQGLVASNEVEWPMLDEGLTEWITGDLLQRRHGRHASGIATLGLRLDGFELRRAFALHGVPTIPPGRPAYDFRSGSYGRSVYGRTAAILETVARTWGRPRFYRALGRYARTQRFQHPTPDALFRAFDGEYGAWMSRRVLRPALMDGAVASLEVTSLEHANGRTRVVANRRGGLPVPSHLELRQGDQRRRIPWPGNEAQLVVDEEGQWERAVADPDHHNLADPDRRDDGRGTNRTPTPFLRWLAIAQALLGAVGP